MSPATAFIRRQRLVKPGLQLKLMLAFLGVSLLALAIQFVLFGFLALRVAGKLPAGGEYLIDELPRMLLLGLGGSLLVLLPAILAVGITVTFRLVGPIHRFEKYLGEVARGEDSGPCRIREGDDLPELCERINEAIESVRGQAALPDSDQGQGVTPERTSKAA